MKKVLLNFVALLFGEAASKIFGFLSTIYLARVLGADSYGVYAFVLAMYSYFSLLANPGFETVGTREIAKGTYSVEILSGSIFVLRVFFTVISLAILVLCGLLFHFDNATRILFLVQGANLLLTPLLIQYIFLGLMEGKYVSLSRIVQSGSFLCLVLLFVRKEGEVLYLPVLFFVSTAVSLMPLFYLYRKRFGRFSISSSSVVRRYILRVSIMMGISGFMISIYYNLDSVLLGFLRSAHEVGLYSAAYKIVLLLTTIPSLILASFFPVLSRNRNEEGYGGVLKQYLSIMFSLGLPVGFGGYFCADWIIHILFGSSFDAAAGPLRILLFNVSLVFVNMAFANPLLAWGEEKAYLRVVAGGAITNIVFNVILIPQFGIIGAASATLLSEVTVFLIARREFYKRIETRFDKKLLSVVAIVLAAFSCSLFVQSYMDLNALIVAGLFTVLYGILLTVFSPVDLTHGL